MATSFTPKKNRVYELDGGKVGTLKFIGRTFFKPGMDWFGFELSEDFKGKNNGSVQGTTYFKCKSGQGIFVKRNKIIAETSHRKGKKKTKVHKAGSRETGRIEYKQPEYELQDTGSFLEERTASTGGSGKVSKKLGPREIGRNEDFETPEYEIQDTGNFLEERLAPSTSEAGETAVHKAGPVETGKIEYNPGSPGN